MSRTTRTVVALAGVSLAAALVAARFHGPSGPWLWNLDMPKIDYPLAAFFHQALRAGGLPLWNDRLGLGFPLYAEGQIGAFYPPNWLLFQLPPLVALDATRVLHLTVAGVGAGLLVLRLAGSRPGAVVAALAAVLGGAITAKLEWHNLVAAYAWLPWILLPLVRRPAPTRRGLVAAAVLFGVQALAGHPNTWLLTGLTAAAVLIATSPRLATIWRVAGFGLLGAAVGGVQLIPTAILTTLSVRSRALSPNDLFTSAATPFDLLGFAFGAPFARVEGGAWNPFTGWYPDGTFALLEAAAFVGLPVLALAAIGAGVRRSRPLVAAAVVLVAIAVVAAFRPEPWTWVPVLNALRSPVRVYLVVALLLGVLAGVGVGRLASLAAARRAAGVADGADLADDAAQGAWARAGIAIALPVGLLGATIALIVAAPDAFDRVLLASATFIGTSDLPEHRARALDALTAPWPLALDLAAGTAILLVVALVRRGRLSRAVAGVVAAGVVAVPLAVLGPLPNEVREEASFSSADSSFVAAVRSADPYRVLTLNPPGFYAGMPDQLAAAGIPDLRMFSSLDLQASDDVTARAAQLDEVGAAVRRALGVDVVVTFGAPCPGEPVAESTAEGAVLCRDEATLRPPYWVPTRVASVRLASGSPIRPTDAEIDPADLPGTAVPARVGERSSTELLAEIEAPADGWVWIDRAWWPAWRTSVDGAPVEAVRALGGQLVPVSAGRHAIEQALVPWDAAAGLALGAVAAVVALGWTGAIPWARRRR